MFRNRLHRLHHSLYEVVRRKVSGRPARTDAISLISNQHSVVPLLRETVDASLLLPGCLQRPEERHAGAATDVAQEWVINPVYLCRIKNGFINLSTGIVHDAGSGKYLNETSWGWAKYSTAAARVFNRRTLRPPTGKPVYVFSCVGYHGIVEDLSAILLLQERGLEFDIVIEQRNTWMISLLRLLLPPGYQVLPTVGGVWINATQALITTKSALGEFVHPELLRALRRAAAPWAGGTPLGPRLFISRGDTANRAYAGEETLAQAYRSRGYAVVRLGDLSVEDQIRAFSEAEAVAGLHGAGFVNLVWGQRPISLCELYFPTWFNSCYYSLSYALGHPYQNICLQPEQDLQAQVDARMSAAGAPFRDPGRH